MATQVRIGLAAAGNEEDNINVINPRYMAEALRQLRGKDCGVLDNSFEYAADGASRSSNANFKWKLTATNISSVKVGRGMATAYGYDIQSEAEVTLSGSAPSAGTKYYFVYLEWDLSNPNEGAGYVKLYDNGSSPSWTPTYQDNLITIPLGKYQMPLYRLTVDTSGAITATASWSSLGVNTIDKVLRSDYSGLADYAKTAYGMSDTIKNTFDSVDARLTALGFSEVDVTSGLDGISNVHLKRQGNYVILTGTVTYSSFSFTIPSGYRPKAQVSFSYGQVATTYNTTDRCFYFTGGCGSANVGTDGSVTGTGNVGYKSTGAAYTNQGSITCTICVGWEAPPRS